MDVTPVKIKFCKICEKDLPWTPEFFHYCDKQKGKLHIYCKICKVAYVTAWKHGEEFKEIERRKRAIKIKKHTNAVKPTHIKKEVKPSKVSNIVIKDKCHPPEIKPTQPSVQSRKRCREAISLFLADRISTDELFKEIKPFYGKKTQSVVNGLRARMGL